MRTLVFPLLCVHSRRVEAFNHSSSWHLHHHQRIPKSHTKGIPRVMAGRKRKTRRVKVKVKRFKRVKRSHREQAKSKCPPQSPAAAPAPRPLPPPPPPTSQAKQVVSNRPQKRRLPPPPPPPPPRPPPPPPTTQTPCQVLKKKQLLEFWLFGKYVMWNVTCGKHWKHAVLLSQQHTTTHLKSHFKLFNVRAFRTRALHCEHGNWCGGCGWREPWWNFSFFFKDEWTCENMNYHIIIS